jgi:tRNA-specific 2-thiouridylase
VPAADGRPRYVLDISPVDNTITVGPHESLAVNRIVADRITWTGAPLGDRGDSRWHGLVQLRAHGAALPAEVKIVPDHGRRRHDQLEVILETSAAGVAPGQTVVLYDDDRVVGSATIASTGG